MWGKIRIKLIRQNGETIGETLVALLISSLALLMLAGAISAASRMITVSNNKMKEYYINDRALVELRTLEEAKKIESGSVTVNIENNTNATHAQGFPVNYYKNKEFDSITPIAYGL